MKLRSSFPNTGKRPTLEELKEATSPVLGFTPDPKLFPRPRRGRPFLHGPLDWGDACQVFTVSREAAAVWFLIHRRRKLTEERAITLPTSELGQLRVDHTAKWRALKALESLGLIRVMRDRGCTVRVVLARED
jgi:hypothetical protein